MRINEIENKIFQELGKEGKLIACHNIIYKLIGVVIDYVNVENRTMNLLPVNHLNGYCAQMHQIGCSQCLSRAHIEKAQRLRHELIYQCHAGLNDLILPLYDENDNYIGAMTTGQFLIAGTEPASREFIEKIAAEHAFDAAELYALYQKSPVLDQTQIDGLIEYLRQIGETITENRSKLLFWEKSNSTERINLIKEYIHKNYMRQLTVPMLAKRFFLSPNHFCRIFKKRAGVNFTAYLNLYRLNKAEDLLKNSDLGIFEIAIQCGFGSISQFYRYFKQTYHLSPQEFRHKA